MPLALFVCGNIACMWHFMQFTCCTGCLNPAELHPCVAQHIMIDLGTGNNNKINWAMNDKQEFVDIVETVRGDGCSWGSRGQQRGRGRQ